MNRLKETMMLIIVNGNRVSTLLAMQTNYDFAQARQRLHTQPPSRALQTISAD